MDGKYQERWQQVCALVAAEKDPTRFSQLIQELLEELHKKEEQYVVLYWWAVIGQAS